MADDEILEAVDNASEAVQERMRERIREAPTATGRASDQVVRKVAWKRPNHRDLS